VSAAVATLELSLGDPAAAWRALAHVAEARAPEANPVLVRLLPDTAEALVELGRAEEAESIARRLETARPLLGRSRGAALRARAVVAAVSDLDCALGLFDEALDEHRRLGSAFDEARTLFARGRVLRRAKRRRLARESLGEAVERFDELGACLWAARARRELERTGTRWARGDALTASEEHVARLAASGRTNREIAQELFVSPKTVEAALSRVYRKLEVRSRAELAARRRTSL
jgi:DNA-binding CsgD family transcriptional regulator